MKQFYTFFMLISVMAFYACDDHQNEVSEIPVNSGKNPSQKPVKLTAIPDTAIFRSYRLLDDALASDEINDTNKMIFYHAECAISINPDDKWIAQQQKEDPEGWDAVADDNGYYQSLAFDTLNKLKIEVLNYDRSRQYLKFNLSGGQNYTLDCTKMPAAWGLILYNGKDKPVLWCGTDISDEIKNIYNR